MPLLVGGNPVSEVPPKVQEIWKGFPSILECAKKLLGLPVVEIGPKRLLYVNQREYAVVHPDDEHIDILGTEDATTCHIAILRHTGSGVTSLAHYDGCAMEQGMKDMVQCVQDMSQGQPNGRLELTLAGGFIDSKQESEKLSKKLLGILKNVDHDIHLITACITEANDVVKGTSHFPVIYGLAVNVKTGEIMRATFPNKGPAINIRSATHFVGFRKMLNIYSPQTGEMLIGPYSWQPWDDVEMFLALPDPFIRRYLSTSPEQEPAYFATQVREALQVLKDHPFPHQTLFPDKLSWRYRLQQNGIWTRIP